jgi:ABC-2 type transport system ATP-binding protein
MGFSTPQQGQCLIRGLEARRHPEVLVDVSYLPGEIALPRSLTGKEVISIQENLKGVIDHTFRDFLISAFQFDPSLVCKDMSLGSKRKLAIICCFMSDPDIIIMDEPSSGLDPEMQRVFIALVKAEKKRGKTILMSSHIFSEIDSCCDRIAVIKDGKIVSIFKAGDLKHSTQKTYLLSFKTLEDLKKSKESSTKIYQVLEENDSQCQLLVSSSDEVINPLIQNLASSGLSDFLEKKETLEDYFMSFYKEDATYGGIK